MDDNLFVSPMRMNRFTPFCLTRDHGSKRRKSARRRGVRFESQLNTASYLKTLKMVPTAVMSDARH